MRPNGRKLSLKKIDEIKRNLIPMKWIITFVFFIFSLSPSLAVPLKVGVTAGPHAIILEKVKELAKAQGLDIQIIEFNDFILPNAALNDKEIDINSYQHQPFLNEQVKTRGYKIKSAGKTVLMPLGIYSRTYKTIADIPEKSKIAIPSDPTNSSRALKLLEKEGLIKLKSSDNPSILDITENPKQLNIIEVDAPQIPRILDEVAAGITNTDWILLAGIDPKSAIAIEDKNSPYANVIAIREDDTRPEIQQFIKIYQSEPVKEFIKKEFKGAIIPVW